MAYRPKAAPIRELVYRARDVRIKTVRIITVLYQSAVLELTADKLKPLQNAKTAGNGLHTRFSVKLLSGLALCNTGLGNIEVQAVTNISCSSISESYDTSYIWNMARPILLVIIRIAPEASERQGIAGTRRPYGSK